MSPIPISGGLGPSGGGGSSEGTPIPQDGVIKPADSSERPREGSREISEGLIVSTLPDWCYKNNKPTPYNIHAFQKDAARLANTIRQTTQRSHAKDSIILHCYGDEEADDRGGIESGTKGAECTPKTWSATVRFEGRNAVRHDDEWWMNHKNTWGRLTYVKDAKTYDSKAASDVSPIIKAQWAGALGRFGPMGELLKPLERAPLADPPRAPTGDSFKPAPSPRYLSPARGLEQQKGPDLKPEPKALFPRPHPSPDNNRTSKRPSRCKKLTICFPNLRGLDVTRFNAQLSEQEGVLNSKPACDTVADLNKPFGPRSKAGSNAAKSYKTSNPQIPKDLLPNNYAALHRLDVIAGGDPSDISRWGDRNINSSIGATWPSRRDCLKFYAEDVCNSNGQCKMVVSLIIKLCGCQTTDIEEPEQYGDLQA